MSNINANDLQQSIFDAVDTIVSRRIKEIDYDKTIIGIINSYAGVKNRKVIYKVEYAGGFFYASVLDNNDTYIKNMPVYVFVPQGDFSKDKIILGRANTINTSSNLNLVATAMNNYSILGKNILELTDSSTTEAGVRSYHSKNTEPNDPIKHRYNVLYNSNNNIEDNFVKIADRQSLLTYVQEGTAILIRADFRTDLPTEQKSMAAARYGLSFKLKFKNENAGWGETQGDILNNISQKISGEISRPDYFISLVNIVKQIEDIIKELKEDNFEDFISLDGIFSEQINLIEELYRVFVTNNPEDNLDIIEETLRAYVGLLKELQTYSTIESIQEGYIEWCETSVESEEFKILPCLLDSNKMTGSPLYFKKPVTQYAIFEADLSNFVGIEEIALFKENFNEDFSKDIKEDIFVQNIQFYILEPLDTVSGDYNLKVESLITGPVLSGENDSVTFTATLSRKIYEDLSANINSYFYWFKEDPSVQIGAEGYDMYGGKGWRLLYSTKESKRTFRTTFDENPSKKNNYKCVAIYKENQDTDVVLECPFIVYNSSKGEIIELQSDLGTVFQFDVGTPTITCLISGQETNIKNNSLNEPIADYYFYWSLNTEDGQEILLYDENNEIDWGNLDIDSFSTYQMQDLYLKNIKFFKLDNDKVVETSNSLEATRLQYPIVNINTGSKVTIKCTVVAVDRENKNRIVQGSGELVFENRKGAVLTGYRIVFDHDNQVFQYDEYGNSPALKTKLDPQEILPIRAKLVGPNGLEISETNIQVDWIFPLEDTMVIPLNTLILNPEDGLQNLLKNSNNCSFSIDDQYNPDATNNQITCRIKYKNVNYYKDTNLFFRKIGENGTNGTDVTVRISPKSSATILNEQPLTLYTYPEEDTTKGFLNDNSYVSNNNILEEIILTGENGYLETEVYQKGTQINSDKYKLMWNLAGNPSESSNSKGNIFDINLDNSNLTNIINWPIKDQKHSTKKTYRLQNIKSHVKMTDAANISKDYYGYYPLPIIEYVSEKPPIYANRRIAIDKKTYLKEITYNADGRNPIYNHNQGLKLINLPLGSTVIWKAKGGWTIGENNPDFSLIFKKDDVVSDNHLLLISVTDLTEEDRINWESIYKKNLINSYLDYVTTAVNCIEDYQTKWENALREKKALEKQTLEKLAKIACCNEIINKIADEENGNIYELFISYLLGPNTIRIYSSQEDIDNNNYTVLKITPQLRYDSVKKLYYDYLYSIRNDEGDYIPVTLVAITETDGASIKSYGYRYVENSQVTAEKYDVEIISPAFEEIVYGDRRYINFERDQIQDAHFWSAEYDWVSNSLLQSDIEKLNENEDDKNYLNQFKWGIEQQDLVLLPYWWYSDDVKWKNYTTDNKLNSEATNEEDFYWFNDKTQIFKEEYNKTLSTEYSDLFNRNDDINDNSHPKDSTIFYYNAEIENNSLEKIFLNENNEIKDFIQRYMALFNISDWKLLFDDRYNNYIEKTKYPSFEETFPSLQESSTVHILGEHDTEASIYIIPNDEASGSSTNNRIEAEIYVRDSKKGTNDLYAIAYVPIIVTLNTFGLASLNAWDGNSVTIDEEDGYVMAPQMGAGEKDSNNRFTGIVMGKTETYTGKSEKEKDIGLLGYTHGIQTIFLDAQTGNATFGLPDGTQFNEDNELIESPDVYSEGRIELRPGGVSKIGGWHLGNRSLFYTQSGDLGEPYSDSYGTINGLAPNHKKDIKPNDLGILLSPGFAREGLESETEGTYISIKGHPLRESEIDTSEGLLEGDSFELQLDSQAESMFTIFKHTKTDPNDEESWIRIPKVGIDKRGRFYSNAVKNPTGGDDSANSTSFDIGAIAAFGKDVLSDQGYVGANINVGTLGQDNTIFKAFISKLGNNSVNSQLYISSSHAIDEYIRPMSLHAKSIKMYAQDSSEDKKNQTTDSNIQLSTNNISMNLGQTNFTLNRKNNDNSNKSFSFSVPKETIVNGDNSILIKNIDFSINQDGTFSQRMHNNNGGTSGDNFEFIKEMTDDSLTIDIKEKTIAITNINSSKSMVYYQKDTNKKNILGSFGFFPKIKNNQGQDINISYKDAHLNANKDVTSFFGVGNQNNLPARGLITTGDTVGLLSNDNLEMVSGDQIYIQAQDDQTTGDIYNDAKPQIIIKAGKGNGAELILNSSNAPRDPAETMSNKYLFKLRRLVNGTPDSIITLYNMTGSSARAGLIFGADTYVTGGLEIQGSLVKKDDVTINNGQRYIALAVDTTNGVIQSPYFIGNNQHSFADGTSSSGDGASISGVGGSGTATFSSVELQSNGRPKLHKHTISVSIPNADAIFNAIKSKFGSAAFASTSDFRSSSWNPDLSGYAKTGTYHLNSGGQIPTAINAGGSITSTSATQNFYITL